MCGRVGTAARKIKGTIIGSTETRGKGQGTASERTTWPKARQQQKPMRTKGAQDACRWTSARPGASAHVYALSKTSPPTGAVTVPGQVLRQNWAGPNSKKSPPPSPKQLLQPSRSLACAITQPLRANHIVFPGTTRLL